VQKLIVICLQCLSVKLYHIQACLSAFSQQASISQWWWPCSWAAFCWHKQNT